MKKITVTVLILCGLTAACTVRSERTVVEKPAPPPDRVVVADPPPPPGTVVYTNR
jgi:hypothetical protein